MPRFVVKLNGTDENPYMKKFGLLQNPFPQVADYKYHHLNYVLNNLEAIPIKDEADLRERLKGATEEFIEGCCKRFKKGEVVTFEIQFEE